MQRLLRPIFILAFVVILLTLIAPAIFVEAATTTPLLILSPIPGATNSSTGSPGEYISTILTYGMGLAGLIAMAQLIFGAVQYTTSAGAPSLQEDAKSRMRGAVVGLVLLILSITILNTIGRAKTDEEILVDDLSEMRNPGVTQAQVEFLSERARSLAHSLPGTPQEKGAAIVANLRAYMTANNIPFHEGGLLPGVIVIGATRAIGQDESISLGDRRRINAVIFDS
jgi:hypothetical protein